MDGQGADGIFEEVAANTNNQPFTTADSDRNVVKIALGDYDK